MRNLKHILLASAVVGLPASLLYANDIDKIVQEAHTAVYDLLDKDSLTIEFEEGSAKLSDSDTRSIRALVKSLDDESKINSIMVASWSDKDFPGSSQVKLTDSDQKLASLRASLVAKEIESLGVKKVKTYNLAEKSNWLAKLLSTEEAEVKKELKGNKVDDRRSQIIAKALENNGGKSKVVIIVDRSFAIDSAS